MKLTKGQTWNYVTVDDVWRAPYDDGVIKDSAGGPLMARLRCKCGHEWEVDCDQLDKKPKTCGREGCRNAPSWRQDAQSEVRPGRPMGSGRAGSAVTFYLPLDVQVVVQKVARELDGGNRSRGLERLVLAGQMYLQAKGEIE